ncbi:Wzz/FepE/Etk N-terminal domain-containing protein, partial [Falsiroseomonas oryzae]|uniref:Wzz/FepE/Etk N-terminal domain-containing protein n=1 Tax=Falsiroseomonas oryzae TaxID=2766473 RepID=UPI0022EAEA02
MLDRTVAETRAPAERRPAARSVPPAPVIEPEGLNLTALLGALRRRRGVLIACLLAFPIIALVAAKNMTPRYTAVTTVMFEPTEYAARELQSILRDESTTDAVLASQVEIVRSLSVARRIVARFGLTERPEFAWWLQDRERADGPVFALRTRAADLAARVSPELAEMLAPEPVAERPPGELAEIQAAEALLAKLDIQVVRNSRVLQIRFTTEDPQLAAAGANLAAELYIADQLDAKFDAVRRANDWLDGRIANLRQEVTRNEAQIAELRSQSGLTRGVNAGLQTEQISRITQDLVEARNQLAGAEARLGAARGGGGGGADMTALASANLVAQRTARDEARRELDRLSATLGSG